MITTNQNHTKQHNLFNESSALLCKPKQAILTIFKTVYPYNTGHFWVFKGYGKFKSWIVKICRVRFYHYIGQVCLVLKTNDIPLDSLIIGKLSFRQPNNVISQI